jgi:hypothetical protein
MQAIQKHTVGNVGNNASSIAIAPDCRQRNKLALFEFSQL